jgi:phosphoribosylformylglycinamidine cyclo-ligase
MCVNDLAASGADPVSFLDYIACGSIDESVLHDVIRGIIAGCEEADCLLTGGETAEMPDMYRADDFDLAGFAVGVVEKEAALPNLDAVSEGAVLFGLASSGIHSNGFSLARKILPLDDADILRELLVPTKIYVRDMKTLVRTGLLTGAAHITGGGLEGNISRIIPEHLRPVLSYDWDVPWIFQEIERLGNVDPAEMRRVYNLGIGMVVCVNKAHAAELVKQAADMQLLEIGTVRSR